jgi:5S rRNA maturation endonuclease (ribonuclease M5)
MGMEKEKLRLMLKVLERILSGLRENWLFVEGLRDKAALEKLGCRKIKTISGNLRKSCEALDEDVKAVIVLTDIDRRGNQLALAAKGELEGMSRTADIETRRKLAGILGLRNFEDAERKYKELMEKTKGD